jgi:hypothetical protein
VRAIVLSAALAACGGGNVDPGFSGPLPLDPAPDGPRAAPTRFARPKLVVISAEWCGICQQVLPGLMIGYAPFEGDVDLLVLDVTDERAIRRSLEVARSEGVSGFFETYMGRTPTVGVLTRPEDPRLIHGPVGSPSHLRRELEAAIERKKTEEVLETPSERP